MTLPAPEYGKLKKLQTHGGCGSSVSIV